MYTEREKKPKAYYWKNVRKTSASTFSKLNSKQ